MNNYFLQKQKNLINLHYQRKQSLERLRQQKQQLFRTKSKLAYMNKINEGTINLPEQTLNDGIISLIHPLNHQFRSRNKFLEKQGRGGIRVKKFLSSKVRAELAEKINKQSLLQNETYIDTYKRKGLRQRNTSKQGSVFMFGSLDYSKIDNNITKVQTSMSSKKQRVYTQEIDYSDKQKWNNIPFHSNDKHTTPWKQTPIYQASRDRYIGGFQQTGDTSRRTKQLPKSPPFYLRYSKGFLNNTLTSQSLRTQMSSQFLKSLNLKKRKTNSDCDLQKLSQKVRLRRSDMNPQIKSQSTSKIYKMSMKSFR